MAPSIKTHCLRGHPFDEQNTWIVKTGARKGQRHCRACGNLRQKQRLVTLKASDAGLQRLKAKRRREYLAKLAKCGREPYRRANRRYHERMRTIHTEFIAAYGGRCQCECGCQEACAGMLTGDHINNDGNVDRKRWGSGRRWKMHLKVLGWPKDQVRLACWNCNCGRAHTSDKRCPRLPAPPAVQIAT